MLSLEKVKKIITDSQFPPELKKRLASILPRLDKYTLTGLGREVSRGDSVPVADYLVKEWENFARLLDGLKKADPELTRQFFKYFEQTENNFDQDSKLYFLDLVLDARTLATSRLNFTSGQYRQILEYEVSLFWNLPKEEVMFLLENDLLFLESKINLLEHIKVIIWENDWDYSRDFSKTFSDLLLRNKEKLGVVAPKTVGAWVKEYFDFSSTAAFRTDVMEVAEFLVKDPLVQALTASEKKTLSEILKLYVWLLNPSLNEDEALSYKEQIEQKEVERVKQLFLSIFPKGDWSQITGASPPSISVSKNAPALKSIQEITAPAKISQQPQPQRPVGQAAGFAGGGKATQGPGAAGKVNGTDRTDKADATNKPLSGPVANIQEILKQRQGQAQASLKPVAPPVSSEELKAAYINKKLEELKKKSIT